MDVNLVKYHVYQQLKADEHKANLIMIMLQFDERWNIVYASLKMDIEMFPFSLAVISTLVISIYFDFCLLLT